MNNIDDIQHHGAKYSALKAAATFGFGFQIPHGFSISTQVSFTEFKENHWESLINSIENLGKYVAIRSSAIVEDGSSKSYAGVFKSFVWVPTEDHKALKEALVAVHKQNEVAVLVQQMIRADLSGVIFTKDPDTGLDYLTVNLHRGDCSFITDGTADGIEYLINRETLEIEDRTVFEESPDQETEEVAKQVSVFALDLEGIFGRPLDIEWAYVRDTETYYILQVRPITVMGSLLENEEASYDVTGYGVPCGFSEKEGVVQKMLSPEDNFLEGQILVVENTSPKWNNVIAKAGGLITNHGCRTSHAAITARELGIPSIVGCQNGTSSLETGDLVKMTFTLKHGSPKGSVKIIQGAHNGPL